MGFLKVTGNLTNWVIYKKALLICDITELFIMRAFQYPTRTVDQMRQAARSCKQNIVEGVSDCVTSYEICIKLLGIARGSNRELMEDYGDYLRQHEMEIWSSDDIRTVKTRQYCKTHSSPEDFIPKCRERSNETVANIMITLCRQMDTMLGKLLKQMEDEFTQEGGIKEAMTRERRAHRGF